MSHAAVDPSRVLAPDNIQLPAGSTKGLAVGAAGLGAVLVIAVIAGGFAGGQTGASVALHALHAGFVTAIGFPLTALAFVMMLHVTNAGWSATVRRQFENMMWLTWVGVPMFFGILILQYVFSGIGEAGKTSPFLWNWMNPEYVRGDVLYEHKQPYLNLWRFLASAVVFFLVWLGLSFSLWNTSTRQDLDGDARHTGTMRRVSAIGLPLLAFTLAFAGFDWIMTLDFHWFSTMLGVHFFAGNMVLSLALGTLTLIVLRSTGRLHVAFTDEHLHDLSKLLFGFTVFWAYIAFSQYFLIWYANIPEETAFYVIRKSGGWEALSIALPIAHFILPFLILLPRPLRRSRAAVAVMCVWLIVVQAIENYWMIRPEVKGAGPGQWMDFAGVAGPILIVIGLFAHKVASGPLVAAQDPRLHEALAHKNHV